MTTETPVLIHPTYKQQLVLAVLKRDMEMKQEEYGEAVQRYVNAKEEMKKAKGDKP